MCPNVEKYFRLIEELPLSQRGDYQVELITMPMAATHDSRTDDPIVRVECDAMITKIFNSI